MANYVVTTLNDEQFDGGEATTPDGDGLSLREALGLALANGAGTPDTITFAPGLAGGTLLLTNGELIVDSDVTIDGDVNGDNVADITIDAGSNSGVFQVTSGTSTLDALVITGGEATRGGGLFIDSGASVTISHSLISGNKADKAGGGIYNQGTATLTNTTVANNTAFLIGMGGMADDRAGGGIYNGYDGTITLVNSTLWGNGAERGGGLSNHGTAILTNSTVTGNFIAHGKVDGGAGIYNYGTATLTNTIVAGNGSYGGDFADFGTTTYAGLNIIGVGNDSDGSDHVINTPSLADLFAALTTIDPNGSPGSGDEFEAGVLANNGGPVPTVAILQHGVANDPPGTIVPPDTTDADNDGDTSEPLPVDARDHPRVGGGGVDVGAFEVDGEPGGGPPQPPAGGQDILGDGGANTLTGSPGDDTIDGLGGNDRLYGGNGNDELFGDDGDDFLQGNRGNDTLDGDNGNDTLLGGQSHDALYGGGGNDLMQGNLGDDSLHGGDGNDTLRGGQGSDLIDGGNGNDLLFGDLGQDTLIGGNGNDTFVFDAANTAFNPSPVDHPDQILDFDLAGDDRLDLGAAGNGTNFLNSGQSAATLADAIGIADGLLGGGRIYVTVNVTTGFGATSDNTVVFWDTNGDGHADEAIALVGTPQVLVGADDII